MSPAKGSSHREVKGTGRRLNRLLKVASARDRALIAADLTQGALQILRPTYAQASALTNVSLGYVTTVSGLTPEERAQLARGLLSLPRLHNRRRRSNAELDRVVEHYGVEAIWRALDRATAPNNG
jgi:hypothetical protein